ncbi:MAG: peptide chain release factor N(5)-glutamine methyltransferase [Bacteroidales bacterium]|nr:peptide chain release factor N(5)-glutamine methyltransferase [Bacteroidales bacterium]
MKFGAFIRAARKRLLAEAAFYSPEECAALVKRMLLAVCASCRQSLQYALPANDVQLVLAENEEIPSQVENECEKALERLCKGEPLEYVLGHAEFCGYEFRVNASTLIPRPETEELVSIVGEHLRTVITEASSGDCGINGGAAPVVLDVCTGSGCIAWSLLLDYVNGLNGAANSEQVRFYGCDISEGALEVAASQFQERPEERETRPEFFKCDVLAPDAAEVIRHRIGDIKNVPLIIVCNPPYVCEKERAQMRSNVLDWEPSSALFVPDASPLIFYEAVADIALKLAQLSGRTSPALFFEINENLGPQTVEMLKSKGFTNARCLKDLFGKDRFIEIMK